MGMNAMTMEVRSEFWLPKHCQVIKDILNRCVRCQKVNATAFSEKPAHLPIERLKISDPFSVTGIDMAGPYNVLVNEPSKAVIVQPRTEPGVPEEESESSDESDEELVPERVDALDKKKKKKKKEKKQPKFAIDGRQIVKVYIVMFTCATTRAVHLEVTRGKSAAAFINAFRRFCALKYAPRTVYSDNALEFDSTARYLRRLWQCKTVYDFMANRNISWRFSASVAPWWGGFWERMIKTVKQALHKTFNPKQMDFDMFHTVITEISDIVNNRPLGYIAGDETALTPNQLIKGGFVNKFDTEPPEEEELLGADSLFLTNREAARRKLVADWWTEFVPTYLKDLNRFHQEQIPSKSVKLGQVVLIHVDYVKRINWNIGRVIELIKGRDHLVRKVKLVMVDSKGKTSIVNRPVQNLYPLEVEPGIIDADFAKNPSRFGDHVTSSGQVCKRTYMGGVWNTTALGDEATDCRPHVAQPREVTIASAVDGVTGKRPGNGNKATSRRPHGAQPRETTSASGVDGGDTNRPSDVAPATGARPRHGPPKMPVVNVPASADLERSNPIEWIDDEDLTPKQLRAEVRRRDRAQAAWKPKLAAQNATGVDPDQREVLDG
jgi:hypothetical protein